MTILSDTVVELVPVSVAVEFAPVMTEPEEIDELDVRVEFVSRAIGSTEMEGFVPVVPEPVVVVTVEFDVMGVPLEVTSELAVSLLVEIEVVLLFVVVVELAPISLGAKIVAGLLDVVEGVVIVEEFVLVSTSVKDVSLLRELLVVEVG